MLNVSLKKNFAWAFIGNALSAFFMWLLLVILTKLGNVETVGTFAVAQAVGLPITMFLGLRLQVVQITDARNEHQFGIYLTLRLLTSVVAIIITAAAGFIFYSYDTALIIFLLGISYAIVAVRETFLGAMQKSERMDKMTVGRVLESGLSLVLFGILYILTHSLAVSVLGLIVSRLMIIFWYDIPTVKKLLAEANMKLMPRWNRKSLVKLFKVAVPLGFSAWLGQLFTSVPRLVLDKYEGKAEVGYFAAISSLLVIGTMVVTSLSQTSSPRLAKYYVENIKAYKFLILKLMGAAILFGIFGVAVSFFFGRWLLSIMFTPEYAQYNYLFVMMTAAGAILFLYTFMNDSLSSARRFDIQLPLCVVAVVACLAASFVFIPKYGMQGAAISILVCYAAGFLGSLLSVIYVYRKRVAEIENSKSKAEPEYSRT